MSCDINFKNNNCITKLLLTRKLLWQCVDIKYGGLHTKLGTYHFLIFNIYLNFWVLTIMRVNPLNHSYTIKKIAKNKKHTCRYYWIGLTGQTYKMFLI